MDVVAPELALVLEQLVRVVRSLATAGELGSSAASVVARLVREGPRRLTDLAAGEGVSQPGMTQLVVRLERDGLVVRTPSAYDRRVVLVEATPHGRDVVARRRRERADALATLVDQLDAADRDAVLQALPALSRLAERALTPRGPS